MFEYVNNVSSLSHNIIKEYIKFPNVAVDCSLGNGFDTKFINSNEHAPILYVVEKK